MAAIRGRHFRSNVAGRATRPASAAARLNLQSAPMKLADLIAAVPEARVSGDTEIEVADLAYDSREVRPGTLYFCFAGQRADGHDFAPAAVKAGAGALVTERELDLPVPQVRVADARAAMAPMAIRFFGDPTAELSVAGITGTNGKTTTAFLLRHVLESAGRQSGLLGTVKRIVGGVTEEVERTTPEAIDLQRTFRRMLDAGEVACVMEVSSHALTLNRADGIRFELALFTNLTQDHLDFHADMEDYFAAKRRLFSPGRASAAVINVDDPYGRRIAADTAAITFSAHGADADFCARDVEFDAAGARFRCLGPEGEVAVRTGLPGDFNVANALAAIAAAHALGIDSAQAAAALAAAGRVPGRFEPIEEGQPFTVLVDYAHTPDSLDNVLRAARRLATGRLICVFGCGGDRDRDKRPLMGRIAAELSDACVITSDNPRSEDPEAIIAEIVAGSGPPGAIDAATGIEVEPDRRRAITRALAVASAGDVVVIAGKGHEQGQEFEDGRKLPFDDREVAREELRRLRDAAPRI
jgi:UDP-N-acetylmuramoyl-L-alanyl-D-glutamate--2,6-diaminopimelate ligase